MTMTPERRERIKDYALPWGLVIFILLFWQLADFVFNIPVFMLPSPSEIIQSFWKWRVPIVDNAAHTLFATVVGFSIAIVVGLFMGVVIGSSTLVYRAEIGRASCRERV